MLAGVSTPEPVKIFPPVTEKRAPPVESVADQRPTPSGAFGAVLKSDESVAPVMICIATRSFSVAKF